MSDGLALENAGHFEMALEAYNEVLEFDSSAFVHRCKARTLYKLSRSVEPKKQKPHEKRYQECVDSYTNANNKQPTDHGHHNKAIALVELGKDKEALIEAEMAFKLNPDYKKRYDELRFRLAQPPVST